MALCGILLLLLTWLLSVPASAAPICLAGRPVVVAGNDGSLILWQTGTELDVLGFHLYRRDAQGRENRVNAKLLPAAVADGIGASYRHRDITGAAGYELGIVDLSGREVRVPCVPAALRPEWAQTLPELPPEVVFQRTAPPRLIISQPALAKAARAPRAGGSPTAERERLKITVTAAGIYRLNAEQIADGLGLPVAEAEDRVATRQFRLTRDGQRLAWLPDAGDRALLFYHPGGKTIYSTQAVYWLERGRGMVLPPLEGPGPAAPAPDTQSFAHTTRFEQDRIGAVFAYNDPTADFWVWDSFFPSEKKTICPIVLEAMAEPEGEVSLHVRVVGSTMENHLAHLYLNDMLVGSGTWYGKTPLSITGNVPAALVAGGTNSLVVSNANAGPSLCYFDYVEATYPRHFSAAAERLRFAAGTNALVTVRGFTNSAVRLADIGDPRLVREIKRVRVETDGAAHLLSFAPESATNRYFAFSAAAIQSPLAIEGWDSPGLKSATNAADYLVITSAQLTNALQPLVEWRARSGRVCRMVEVREIADEFGHGSATPQAIRAFLAHALSQWRVPPRAVLLGGKGSYDYRNDTGTAVNHVPVLLVPTSTYLFASDNALADVAGDDGVPELAIGRLPANTAVDMTAMVARIIAYEQDDGGDWTRRAILTADDPDDGGNFPASSELAPAELPPTMILQRICLTNHTISAAHTALISAINGQAALWNYFGHGGFNVLDGGWLSNNDTSKMTNGHRAPVLLGMTCFIARHELPGYASLGETLMTRPNGGVIALWAPTGLSYNGPAEVLNQAVLRARYQQGIQPLGEALRIGLEDAATDWVSKDLIQIFTLLGDPGMVMK